VPLSKPDTRGDADGPFQEQAHAGEEQQEAVVEGPPQAAEGGRQEGPREEVARRRFRQIRSRRAVAAALVAVDGLGAGRPLRLALAASLAQHPGIGPKERRHAAAAARSVARWLRVVDAALVRSGAPKAIPEDRSLLRYLAWRVAVEGDRPEAVARDLRLPGPRRPRAISDADVLRVARALPRPGPDGPLAFDASGIPIEPPSDPVVALALRGSVPDGFARRLLRDLGQVEAAACLRGLNRELGIVLRVNVARTTRDEVGAALSAAGIPTAPGEGPWALRVEDRAGLFDAPALRDGLAEVQDESSQRAVEVCGARAGQRWVDLCAGSGGKSLGLAALGARVTAWDASERRLADLPRRARRAGAQVEVARHEPEGEFDGVLVDAPCSGSGALSREPDARWRIDDQAVDRFQEAQRAVLERAARLVRPGGALVFATCSLFREEGEEVVEPFLSDHPDFQLTASERRWPHRQPGAGFYLARLERRAPPRARSGGRTRLTRHGALR
jgi:16S rRNA (cytosine967-C5)-methyltransferase